MTGHFSLEHTFREYNMINGGRQAEYNEITRDPRIDLCPNEKTWKARNGDEKPLIFVDTIRTRF